MTDKAQHDDDDGERPIPNEAIGLGDALDVDAMRTVRDPIEAVVRLTIGNEAFARMRGAITGHDDDVLLAIEHTIQDALRLGQFDPNDDERGVYVDGLGVVTEAGVFEVIG